MCHEGCSGCNHEGKCSQCMVNHGWTEDMDCKPCPQGCTECHFYNDTNISCSTCIDGKMLQNNDCVDDTMYPKPPMSKGINIILLGDELMLLWSMWNESLTWLPADDNETLEVLQHTAAKYYVFINDTDYYSFLET